jgi:hypothetical protein
MPDSQQSILSDSVYAFPSECHTVLEVTLRHVGMERMISLKKQPEVNGSGGMTLQDILLLTSEICYG